MKTQSIAKVLAATLIGLAGASAHAGSEVTDANYPGPSSLSSNKTYAQVQQELAQARADGYKFDDATYPGPFTQASTAKTREQVKQELANYRASGAEFNDATYPEPAHGVAYGSNYGAQRHANSGNASTSVQ